MQKLKKHYTTCYVNLFFYFRAYFNFDFCYHLLNAVLPRLQTGMRGAFGKPLGCVARVNIGQVIMSVRSKDQYEAACIESFRRAKFKFPGRQKVYCWDHYMAPWC